MENTYEIEAIEKLISKGETEKALEKTKDYLKDKDAKLYRECLILSNRYYEIKNDFLLNLVDKKESSTKIVLGLLNILKRVENKDKSLNTRIVNRIHELTNSLSGSQEELSANYILASKTERFIGFLLQELIIFLFAFMLITVLGGSVEKFYSQPITVIGVIMGGVFSGILGAVFYPLWSGNIGHKILGLKVIEVGSNREYDKRIEGFKRESLKSVLGYLIVPFIWLFYDKKRQNIYDKITNTIVIKM